MSDIIDEYLVWVDMETTGLDPHVNRPLEIGFALTDLNFDIMESRSWVIHNTAWAEEGHYSKEATDEFVLAMHEKSGLWSELDNGLGLKLSDVREEINYLLAGWCVDKRDPLCGSSVGFDRDWMKVWFPESEKRFSYRNIDVSSIKELMMRLSPEIYKELEGNATKREMHRVIPDIEDTISELKFYRKEFLYVPTDFMV